MLDIQPSLELSAKCHMKTRKTDINTINVLVQPSLVRWPNVRFQPIDGLQSIPRESNNKDVAAMLVELTIEADEESFVIVIQHGGNDITCKRSISVISQIHVKVM